MVDALILRPLQMKDSARVVEVWEDASWMGFPQNTPAPANMLDWKQRNRAFTDMAATRGDLRAITGDGQPQQVEVTLMTANLLPLLGVEPIVGRGILPQEDHAGGPKVVLLSHRLWMERYGGDKGAIGRDILLDGVKFRVIGVMPRAFVFPGRSDVWLPMAFSPADWARRQTHLLHVFARLRPGVTVAGAQREMSAIAAQLRAEHPDTNDRVGVAVVGIREQFLGKLDLAMRVLAGGVAIVPLICCANIAGLLLARAAGRRREIAVRAALGAGRWALIRQSLAESLIIAAAGAGLGVLLAAYGMRPLSTLIPEALTGWAHPEIDARLLLFASATAMISAAVFGALPAANMARADLSLVLIGIGAAVTRRPLPHHRTYGSVYGGSRWLRRHFIEQRRKTERFEVRIGKPHREGLSLREIPGAKPAASGVACQPRAHPEFQQRGAATTRCFPLPPHSRPESQPDPAG